MLSSKSHEKQLSTAQLALLVFFSYRKKARIVNEPNERRESHSEEAI